MATPRCRGYRDLKGPRDQRELTARTALLVLRAPPVPPGAAARQDHRARRVLPALWGRRGPKGLPAPTAHRVLGALKGHRELKDRGVRTARRGQRARRARHVRASRPLRTLGAGRSGWACRTCRACRAHRPERQLSRIYRGDGPQRR